MSSLSVKLVENDWLLIDPEIECSEDIDIPQGEAFVSIEYKRALDQKVGSVGRSLIEQNRDAELVSEDLPLLQMSRNQICTLFPCRISGAAKKGDRDRFEKFASQDVALVLPNLPSYQVKLISDKQIQEIDWKSVTVEVFQSVFLYCSGDDSEIRHRISLLSVEVLSHFVGKVYTKMYEYLSDSQIQGICTKDCPPEVFDEIFLGWRLDDQTTSHRLSLISQKMIFHFLGEVDTKLYRFLPDACYENLPLSQMDQETIHELFPIRCNERKREEDRLHFRMISSQEVAAALHLLKPRQSAFLSDQQIREIDWFAISPELFQNIFFYWTHKEEEIRHKISCLSVEIIRYFLEKGSFDLCKYLSDFHMQEIGRRGCSVTLFYQIFLDGQYNDRIKRHRISLFLPETIVPLLPQVDSTVYKYLSDRQVAFIGKMGAPLPVFEAVFNDRFQISNEGLLHRATLLEPKTVGQMIHLMEANFINLLSDLQIAAISLENVPQSHIDRLFPPFTFENIEPGHTYRQDKSGRKVIHIYEYQTETDSSSSRYLDATAQKIVVQRRALCLKYGALFLRSQIEAIKSKLSPEVADLLLEDKA